MSDEAVGALSLVERRVLRPVLRRVPGQARSWRRVETILWAAEELLEELGYEGLVANPNMLLERADVPPGTFYAYFENTESVVECVRLAHTQRTYRLIDEAFQPPVTTWPEAIDRIIDAFAEFYASPTGRELWLVHSLTPAVRQAELEANEYIGARIRREVESLGYEFTGGTLDEMVLVELVDQLTRFALLSAQTHDWGRLALDKAKDAGKAFLATLINQQELSVAGRAPAQRDVESK